MTNRIDHVTVGASSLLQGVEAMKAQLGVDVPSGGQHTLMSTHNHVMRSGPENFLEIIAIDPDAPPPSRRRWFTLDDTATQARLAERPRALCWVVRTDDLDALVAKSPLDLGEVLSMSRGDRSWRLTVPKDGSLLEAGLLPAFIEWSPGPHPSVGMADLRVTLEAVQLSHPDPARLTEVLEALQISQLVTLSEGPRALSFAFETPGGLVTLD